MIGTTSLHHFPHHAHGAIVLDRPPGYDRTQQIYGEAQTCLHQVVFDAGNNAASAGDRTDGSNAQGLPVPRQEDFDQSYEYEQAAEREAYESEQQQHAQQMYLNQNQTGQPYMPAYDGQAKRTSLNSRGSVSYVHSPTGPSTPAEAGAPSRSYQPLTTPAHVGDLESEFAEAVNAPWRENGNQAPYSQAAEVSQHAPAALPQEYQQAAPQEMSYAAQQQSYTEEPQQYTTSPVAAPQPAYPEGDHIEAAPAAVEQPYTHPTIPEETDMQADPDSYGEPGGTDREAGADAPGSTGVGGFAVPTSDNEPAAHPETSGAADTSADIAAANIAAAVTQDYSQSEDAPAASEPASNTPVPQNQSYEEQQQQQQGFTPSGEDLYGTGLYGNAQPQQQEQMTETQQQPQQIPTSATAETITPQPNFQVESPLATPDLREAPQTGITRPEMSEAREAQTTHHTQTVPPASAGPAQTAYSYDSPSSHPAISSAPATTTSHGTSPTASIPQQTKSSGNPPSSSRQRTTSSGSTNHAKSAPSPMTPSSPPHRKSSGGPPAPAKQSSYSRKTGQSSKQQQQQIENDYSQRSSIAYLNEPPSLQPPMKAPPPVTSGLPLPSTSPYFNSYANLRSYSGHYDNGYMSSSASSPGLSGGSVGSRPKGARVDSALGSRFGYDMKAVDPSTGKPATNNNSSSSSYDVDKHKPLRQQPVPNVNPGAVTPKDYSYAIKSGDDASSSAHGGGGKRLNAGAFRRAPPSNSSYFASSSNAANNADNGDGAISPAQRLRDEWRASTYSTPMTTPAVEVASSTPSQDPQLAQADPANARHSTASTIDPESMYNDRQAHSTRAGPAAGFTHRTSAVDAPTDVLPHDEISHTSLSQMSGINEETLPLNVHKRASSQQVPDDSAHNRHSIVGQPQQPGTSSSALPPPAYDGQIPHTGSHSNSGQAGFGGSSRYVTNLE